ncbi:glycine radical domain-containing protein [Vibrio sp. kj40-1]|uniref:Glycine radical domain-containing protein n=2 Tax=Vibrio algarum TaxID=3020714 RepID=A0ABT4YU37_9VIBR|nr:glycine radical domain-containing protein [Vibrio sp. KJ40-1]
MASAISPVQGKDVNGPTAAINSLLKTDLSVATNGMVLDIKFSPTFFDKKSHHQALRMLVQAYAEQGGGEIQFNVMDRDTLLDAQTNPEQYKDLVVRVSGFSAYFTSLVKETQDEIILRTEHLGV